MNQNELNNNIVNEQLDTTNNVQTNVNDSTVLNTSTNVVMQPSIDNTQNDASSAPSEVVTVENNPVSTDTNNDGAAVSNESGEDNETVEEFSAPDISATLLSEEERKAREERRKKFNFKFSSGNDEKVTSNDNQPAEEAPQEEKKEQTGDFIFG